MQKPGRIPTFQEKNRPFSCPHDAKVTKIRDVVLCLKEHPAIAKDFPIGGAKVSLTARGLFCTDNACKARKGGFCALPAVEGIL